MQGASTHVLSSLPQDTGFSKGSAGQAALPGLGYVAPVPLRLIQVIAGVCKFERREADIKQSRVAAALNVDQSTIARFEKGNWPEDVELTARAYADTLEIPEEKLWRRIMDVRFSVELQAELMLEEMFQDLREGDDSAA